MPRKKSLVHRFLFTFIYLFIYLFILLLPLESKDTIFLAFCSFRELRKEDYVYFKASLTLCGLAQIACSEITEKCSLVRRFFRCDMRENSACEIRTRHKNREYNFGANSTLTADLKAACYYRFCCEGLYRRIKRKKHPHRVLCQSIIENKLREKSLKCSNWTTYHFSF